MSVTKTPRWLLAALLVLIPAGRALAEQQAIHFEADILPILEDNCFQCHGKNKQRAELRVDQLSSLIRGGGSGEPAVVPGKSDESYLIKAVTGMAGGKRMPLNMGPLTDDEIDLLRKWIDAGAKWPGQDVKPDGVDPKLDTDHWSLKPVSDPEVPRQADDPWASNAIDAFILRRLEEQGLKPSPEAERRTLIRRAVYTLHGLLPTPEQVGRYESDQRPDWYAQMVDELLDSPRYGERWARHWLDLVRYAETHGFEMNQPRNNAYHYRDYVIRALNQDKPYDRFILDQIAGDVTGEQAATGFLVAGPHDQVANQDPAAAAVARDNELADMVNATSTTLIGMTVACARCHNHKFDPILATDYYAMAAVFSGVQHSDREVPQDKDRVAKLNLRLVDVKTQLDAFEPLASPDPDVKNARPPVDPRHNIDRFKPIEAKYIRFVIESTNSKSQPCLDEMEVYAAAGEEDSGTNIALAESGATASSSGDLPGYAIHKLEHINDGKHGNANSWISNTPSGSWVQITLPEARRIDRIVWGRDQTGRYSDRVAVGYRIEVATKPGQWTVVASSADRAASPDQYQPKEQAEQIKQLLAEQKSLMRKLSGIAVYAGTFKQPGASHRLYRGDPAQPREIVAPDTLAILGELELQPDAPEQQRRYAFAKSLTSSDHPLTARVMVNRIWQHHFGQGLVTTPSDFGTMGVPPTHPELVDYLASRFIENKWSIKSMHRLILNASTFKQASTPRTDALERDSASAMLWRFPPRRHEAEAIRDNVLLVSGKLDLTMYGPGFSLFEPNNNYVRVYKPKREFGPEDWRRMIYAHTVRMEREVTFGSFDCPDGGQPTPMRTRSTTAIQALSLLNSPFIIEQSRFFAERLRKEAGDDAQAQVHRAYDLLYNRVPTEQERSACVAFVTTNGLENLCRVLFNTNEFLIVE